jgi:hypothetical protein
VRELLSGDVCISGFLCRCIIVVHRFFEAFDGCTQISAQRA